MKRKTNLFYLSGDDSNFLTFSNYTESLTGVILSTDNKIFPSKFLCFNIKTTGQKTISTFVYNEIEHENIDLGSESNYYVKNEDNTYTKVEFTSEADIHNDTVYYIKEIGSEIVDRTFNEAKLILKKYLIRYYENKLAKLRDYCKENNEMADNKIKPLNYLLETFDILKEKENIEIELIYVGEICEQDYNGTFNDMICTIDTNNLRTGKIIYQENNDNIEDSTDIIPITEESELNYLYGWISNVEIDDNEIIFSESIPKEFTQNPGEYEPIFDDDEYDENNENKRIRGKYFYNSKLERIDCSIDENDYETIEFDLVVPLYDLIDINYQNNYVTQDEDIKYINLNETEENKDLYNYNIPYGIWFATDKIKLNRDKETHMGPSWSLVLSSQFKPFPYSNVMPNELEISGKADAYYTFAQILARQNELLDEFNRLNSNFIDFNKRLVTLETKLNVMGSAYTTEILNKNMMIWEKEMLDKYNNLQETVYSYLDGLNWKFRNG